MVSKLDFVPDTTQSALEVLSFNPHVNPDRFYFKLHFSDEEAEVQRA